MYRRLHSLGSANLCWPPTLLVLLVACCRWRELAKTKYAAWQQDSKQRTAAAAVLKQHLDDLLQTCQWQPGCLPQEVISSNKQAGLQQQDQQPTMRELVQQQWQAIFQRAAHLDSVGEVPSHLLCPLTMEVRAWGLGACVGVFAAMKAGMCSSSATRGVRADNATTCMNNQMLPISGHLAHAECAGLLCGAIQCTSPCYFSPSARP